MPFYRKNKEGITSVVKKRGKGYDQEHKKQEGSQDPVNGETIASQWLRSRGSDSNVELNDTRINQKLSPMEN
jgi:hypothetical protein